jgi:hypothetical protein
VRARPPSNPVALSVVARSSMGPFPMLSNWSEMLETLKWFRDRQKILRSTGLPQRLIRHGAP